MTEQQPRPGDRVRVTFEATASFSSEKGLTVILPGDDEFAQRFCVVPAHATVEVLNPPTLAERMAALADELEAEPGYGGYGDGLSRAVRRIREEITAHEAEAPAEPPVEYFQDANGMWSWRCNGAPGCSGWISHHEHSETAAQGAWEDHVKRTHKGAS